MSQSSRARLVATRAVSMAAATDVHLPDGLALWRLAGGRPPLVAAEPGTPDALGVLLEASLAPDARTAAGAHYTPTAIADGLVERALRGRVAPAVGDPACGGGALLLAAARHQERAGGARRDIVRRLWGADVDPLAAATTEVALALWAGVPPPPGQIGAADALVEQLGWPRLDVIVGNPPFLSQLARRTTRPVPLTARLKARFRGAVRAYTDTASLFLLLGCELARPGGTVAMLQPISVLASRDAGGVRDAVEERGVLREIWVPQEHRFDAAVDVCATFIDVTRADGPRDQTLDGSLAAAGPTPVRWSGFLARHQGVPEVELHSCGELGDGAAVAASFRAEYYGLAPHLEEQRTRPHGSPVVTTGLVELGRCAWGERSTRIAKQRWQAPVVDVDRLDGRARGWALRTQQPKVVVATQTAVVEAAVDEDGTWIAGVPLLVVLADPDRLWPLAAALCAPPVSAWVAHRTAGTALSASALKLTAGLVRQIPLPADRGAWSAGTDALRSGDLSEFAEAMTVAYGAGDDVLRWWSTRAKLAWPAGAAGR